MGGGGEGSKRREQRSWEVQIVEVARGREIVLYVVNSLTESLMID